MGILLKNVSNKSSLSLKKGRFYISDEKNKGGVGMEIQSIREAFDEIKKVPVHVCSSKHECWNFHV